VHDGEWNRERGRVELSQFLEEIATAATLVAQIPERAQWEITFPRVEAAAGLSDMKGAPPESFEARLMQRSWAAATPMTPVPFLRLFQVDGTVRAQLFVYWAPRDSPGRQPEAIDLCSDGICVRPIEMKEQRNWREAFAALAHQDACPTTKSETVSVCVDCEQVWIKTTADGKYREQSCQQPAPDTPVGALLQVMNTAARAAR
jgi:hypothetical protein